MRIEQTPAISRADRVTLGRPGTMRDPGRAPIDVLIENLSETGALLRTAGTLPVGTLVSIGIPGAGIRFARITRLAEGALAAEFMVPLDPAAVRHARSAETLVSVAFPQIERPAVSGSDAGIVTARWDENAGPAVPADVRTPSGVEIEAIADQLRAAAVTDPALTRLLRDGGASARGLSPGTWLIVACVLIAGLLCLLL